ncbi:hypothetical protein GCM10027265_32560 [Jatrophihabitans fulvus]
MSIVAVVTQPVAVTPAFSWAPICGSTGMTTDCTADSSSTATAAVAVMAAGEAVRGAGTAERGKVTRGR